MVRRIEETLACPICKWGIYRDNYSSHVSGCDGDPFGIASLPETARPIAGSLQECEGGELTSPKQVAHGHAMRKRSDGPAILVQLVAIWVAVGILLLVGLPAVLGGLVAERNALQEVCSGSSTSIAEVLRMLVTRHLGDCEIGEKANNIRLIAWVVVAVVIVALVVFTFMADMYLPVGSDDVLVALGTAVIGLVALAVMAIVALAYLMVVAFAYMVGLMILLWLSS